MCNVVQDRSRRRRLIAGKAGTADEQFARDITGDARMIDVTKVLYTASATAVGGRAGHVSTDDGRLDIGLDIPTTMGGSGGPGTNPEQLFAAGYAACFQSTLLSIARQRKLDISEARVHARVSIGQAGGGGFALEAALDLDAPQISAQDAAELMTSAHARCPYSRATRDNIQVTLTVAGTAIEPAAV
jgi:osmotically inducible protein OsmC